MGLGLGWVEGQSSAQIEVAWSEHTYSPSLDYPPLPDAVKSCVFTDIRQEWNAPSVGEFGGPK